MHIQHSAYAAPRTNRDVAYETPAERLAAEVRAAIAASNGDTRAAVLMLLQAAADDAEVAWELFAPYHERAARDAVLGEMRKTERAGQPCFGAQGSHAPAPSPLQNDRFGKGRTDADTLRGSAPTGAVPQQPCSEGRLVADTHTASAPDAAVLATSRPIHVAAPQRAPRGLAAVQEMNRGLMRTFLVNGRPIADVTAGEARAWGEAQKQRGRFAILMAEGVPDNMRIGDCKTEQDATRAAELSRA